MGSPHLGRAPRSGSGLGWLEAARSPKLGYAESLNPSAAPRTSLFLESHEGERKQWPWKPNRGGPGKTIQQQDFEGQYLGFQSWALFVSGQESTDSRPHFSGPQLPYLGKGGVSSTLQNGGERTGAGGTEMYCGLKLACFSWTICSRKACLASFPQPAG